MTTISRAIPMSNLGTRALEAAGERWFGRTALTAIVALAAGLRLYNLSALGYGNHYYTAAIVSMLQSWHNFFFVAAEPGGAVSVDKPPVGFWIQTVSAYFFGVNGFGVLLPEIIAGILSVIVIYHLVKRKFGTVAGLVAGLAYAITPIVVATDRNNTIDSLLILTLLLAAWAFVKATETTRFHFLLLGALLVGIGFNIKMLQAYLPLPAFYALYLLGSADRLWRKVIKLTLATVLLLVVSLSWAVIVDSIPASERPFVGSSGDNSVLDLALGYNGMNRLLGMGGRGGISNWLSGLLQGTGQRDGQPNSPPNGGPQMQQGMQPPRQGDGAPQPLQDGRGGPGGPGGGFPGTGQPSAARLFTSPLSKEASWLLPFAILGALLALFRSLLRWTLTPKHQAFVLWGTWLLTSGVFFSVAGFFHEYYLVMLAPPIAALVGIGVIELWQLRDKHPWWAMGLLLIASAGTLWLQYNIATAVVRSIGWLPILIGLFAIGAAFLIVGLFMGRKPAAAGFVLVIAALFLTPGIWSWLTVLNASPNQTLPAAYNGGQSFGPANQDGSQAIPRGYQVNEALLNFLQANTQGIKYLMAVPSSMQGADYVIATGRPVLYLGGFSGQDQVETADSLATLVADHELRYVYLGGGGGPNPGGQSNISSWVTSKCKLVRGYDTSTQNIGAPDGTGATLPSNRGGAPSGPGGMNVSLYDCGG